MKNSLIYGSGNMVIKLVGLLLIPIYTNTKYLSLNDFGAFGVLEASIQVLIALLGLALPQALTRWYWDKQYINRQKSIFFTVFVFLAGISLLFYFLLAPFSAQISKLIFHHTQYSFLIKLMLISSGFQTISLVPLTLMKLTEKSVLYSISSITKLLITLSLTIYLVVFVKMGLNGIYISQITGAIIFFLFLTRFMREHLAFRFEGHILREMLAYSYPLILGTVSGVLLMTFDRFSLNYLGSLPDVGAYTLGYKIANTIKILIVVSMQLAISPKLYKMMDQPGNKRFYSKVMTYFSFVVMLAVIGLSVFSLETVKVLSSNKEYWRAIGVIPVISFSIFFGMLKDASLIGLQITKKTKIIGIVITLVAALNLGLNILFIPKFSIMGASLATLLSQIIYFVIIIIYAQKHYQIPYEFWKITKMTGLAIVIVIVGFLLSDMTLFWRLLIKSLLILAFPVLLYFLGFYEPVELNRLQGFWLKWRKPGDLVRNVKHLFSEGD